MKAAVPSSRAGVGSWILNFLAGAGTGVAVGFATAIVVVWAFFSDTRGDSLAAGIITFVAAGLLANALVFAWLTRDTNKAEKAVVLAAAPWLLLTAFATWTNAKEALEQCSLGPIQRRLASRNSTIRVELDYPRLDFCFVCIGSEFFRRACYRSEIAEHRIRNT